MITRELFARVMQAFADRIGRPIGAFTAELYYRTLSDELTDEQFETAAAEVFKRHTYNTWPAPQLFLDAVKAELPALDCEQIGRHIGALGHYTSTRGVIPPNVHQVREAFGELIADAYAAAGGARMFSDNPTTRDIAEREFQKALSAAVERAAIRGEIPQWGRFEAPPRPVRMLPAGADRKALPENLGAVMLRITDGAQVTP